MWCKSCHFLKYEWIFNSVKRKSDKYGFTRNALCLECVNTSDAIRMYWSSQT
jgi:hypothetical protein